MTITKYMFILFAVFLFVVGIGAEKVLLEFIDEHPFILISIPFLAASAIFLDWTKLD